jgi:hypothetical protein
MSGGGLFLYYRIKAVGKEKQKKILLLPLNVPLISDSVQSWMFVITAGR